MSKIFKWFKSLFGCAEKQPVVVEQPEELNGPVAKELFFTPEPVAVPEKKKPVKKTAKKRGRPRKKKKEE